MQRFLLKWAVNSVAILVVVHTIKGIEISNTSLVVVVALVLGIINAFLRPILIAITLPINVLTLGVFTFFINGFLFYLVSKIVKGFTVTGFWPACFGAILFSIVSFLLSLFVRE
ncbi:MAG: phage holin family protein [Candidatus Omnitrophota bacterium]